MHYINNHNNPKNPKNHSSDNFHAQAILTAYYDHQYPIVLETQDGLQYRSNSELRKDQIITKSLLSIDPSPINDVCIIKLRINDKLINAKLKVYALDGKLLANTSISNQVNEIKLESRLWPNTVFTVVLLNDDKIIASVKSVKN
ncbi:MAG: hypothetical protein IPQ02_11230 [Saprospiraceae bacterium]|nr:hypothetical protein [Candidatus Defluviibacterium haderslevense]